jgi:DNA-binding CsgD family transcriptional regulator
MPREPSPPDELVAAEVAAVSGMAAPIDQRAHALLEPLRRILTFDAACLTLLDPEHRHHEPLLRYGYPEALHAYLDSSEFVGTVERLGLHHRRPPLRVKDLPLPPTAWSGWARHMAPAGFREGISVPLHTYDDRYLGLLAMHTTDATPPSDTVRDQLAALAPLIAHAVDPLRGLTAFATLVGDVTGAAILTRAGNTVPLPGLPNHPLLTSGSATITQAAALRAIGDQQGTFLTPGRHPRHDYLKVTMLACPEQPPRHLTAIVLLSPPGDLHGLTRRHLVVLGMLIAGWDTTRIAARLGVRRYTVIHLVDQVRAALAAPTREAAIMRAARRGLYLPPSLTA